MDKMQNVPNAYYETRAAYKDHVLRMHFFAFYTFHTIPEMRFLHSICSLYTLRFVHFTSTSFNLLLWQSGPSHSAICIWDVRHDPAHFRKKKQFDI